MIHVHETTKRYVIHPSSVRAKDGDTHFITARQLMDLYRVQPTECIVDTANGGQWALGYSKPVLENLIHLYPREEGSYGQPTSSPKVTP